MSPFSSSIKLEKSSTSYSAFNQYSCEKEKIEENKIIKNILIIPLLLSNMPIIPAKKSRKCKDQVKK